MEHIPEWRRTNHKPLETKGWRFSGTVIHVKDRLWEIRGRYANDKMDNNVLLYSLLADVDDKLHWLWLHLLAKW